ncbi:MAG: glycoside hydrolase [Terriglobia bacterium]
MVRRVWIAAILSALFATVSYAADINGRWEGSINGPNGDMQIQFNFKVDGAKLTGTVESPNGEIPIEEGKVYGDHISFTTHIGNNEVKHNGTASGDTIQLKVEGPWGQSEMTLNRAKEKKSSVTGMP